MAEEENKESLEEFMARIRKTISDSRDLISQAELRMAETDRMLAANGLTREQVLDMRISKAQRLAVNEELRRRGLPPIEEEEESYDFDAATAAMREAEMPAEPALPPDQALAERQRKFGNLMREYRI